MSEHSYKTKVNKGGKGVIVTPQDQRVKWVAEAKSIKKQSQKYLFQTTEALKSLRQANSKCIGVIKANTCSCKRPTLKRKFVNLGLKDAISTTESFRTGSENSDHSARSLEITKQRIEILRKDIGRLSDIVNASEIALNKQTDLCTTVTENTPKCKNCPIF